MMDLTLFNKYKFNFDNIDEKEIKELLSKEINNYNDNSNHEYIRLLCGYLACISDDRSLIKEAKAINMDLGTLIDSLWISGDKKYIQEEFKLYYSNYYKEDKLSNKYFEKELPSGYRLAKYINAKDLRFGIIMNLVALAVIVVVMVIACLFAYSNDLELILEDVDDLLLYYVLTMGGIVLYIILHELTHGFVYKLLTKEKLTFGFSWSCAYCGVPNIYTYRKTAVLALVAPLVLFSIILLVLMLVFFKINVIIYLILSFIFGLHLGGCSGDIYGFLLFMFKYKNPNTLMKDTGPEQYFYVRD